MQICAIGYGVADFDLGTSLLTELNHLFFHILVLPILKNSRESKIKLQFCYTGGVRAHPALESESGTWTKTM